MSSAAAHTNSSFTQVKRLLFDAFGFGYIFLSILIAFNPPDEEQMLMLGRNLELFLGFSVVGFIISFLMLKARKNTLGEVIFVPRHLQNRPQEAIAWYQSIWGIQAASLFLVSLIFAFFVCHIDIIKLLEKESFDHAMNLFSQLAQPDWHILPKAVMKIIETVFIAFMATIIAVPVAFVLSFLSAKNLMGKTKLGLFVYAALRLLFNVSRSIEPILWAIIFSIWVGFGPFAGMLSLMIHSIASLSKQYSECVEGVEDGPIEGIRSTGAGTLQVIWFAIVPQIILPYISFTIYRWDINVRMATIIGFVGGGGIGTMLLEYQGQAQWPQVGCIIVVIALVVWLMDSFSAYIREAVK